MIRAYRLKIVLETFDRVQSLHQRVHEKARKRCRETGEWSYPCPVCGEVVTRHEMHARGKRYRHSDRFGDQCVIVGAHPNEPPVGLYVGHGPLFEEGGQRRLI